MGKMVKLRKGVSVSAGRKHFTNEAPEALVKKLGLEKYLETAAPEKAPEAEKQKVAKAK